MITVDGVAFDTTFNPFIVIFIYARLLIHKNAFQQL